MNKHVGSTFDSFLKEEGLLAPVFKKVDMLLMAAYIHLVSKQSLKSRNAVIGAVVEYLLNKGLLKESMKSSGFCVKVHKGLAKDCKIK